MVITTTQLRLSKPELRFCLRRGSNPARGVSEIRDGEDLWQWSQLEIRLNAFRRSTIPQKQFIIIIIIRKLLHLVSKAYSFDVLNHFCRTMKVLEKHCIIGNYWNEYRGIQFRNYFHALVVTIYSISTISNCLRKKQAVMQLFQIPFLKDF